MNWTDEYREIVEFYYWEPQHLGRAKGEKRFQGPAQMWEHVNKLEVSLNHILNVFFSLYDNSHLFKSLGLPSIPYRFVSSRQLELWQKDIGGFTQPDMYFYGHTRNLAIEIKLASKTDIKQLSKYVAFNGWVNSKTPLDLLLLTPHDNLSQTTKEKFKSTNEIIEQLRNVQLSKKSELACSREAYESQLSALTITCLSFREFSKKLRTIVPENVTEEKLLSGLLEYLNDRNLA